MLLDTRTVEKGFSRLTSHRSLSKNKLEQLLTFTMFLEEGHQHSWTTESMSRAQKTVNKRKKKGNRQYFFKNVQHLSRTIIVLNCSKLQRNQDINILRPQQNRACGKKGHGSLTQLDQGCNNTIFFLKTIQN